MSAGSGWGTRLSFLLGVVAVVAAGWSARLPQASGTAGADVTIVAQPSGELTVTPTGPFARGLGLEPGRARQPARGSIAVHNNTGGAADVHVRVLRSISDLDRLLQVEVTASGTRVYSGSLGGLQSWTTASFRLARGGDTRVTASAYLPASVRDGYQSRIADLTLELRLDPVGA